MSKNRSFLGRLFSWGNKSNTSSDIPAIGRCLKYNGQWYKYTKGPGGTLIREEPGYPSCPECATATGAECKA
ncbi:MAG: hypothetical protein H6550_00790 [Chitinophagales bacterium]|nr:hypothetical protein [Chitinophagales bacterium]